jgi:hypothetical protein
VVARRVLTCSRGTRRAALSCTRVPLNHQGVRNQNRVAETSSFGRNPLPQVTAETRRQGASQAYLGTGGCTAKCAPARRTATARLVGCHTVLRLHGVAAIHFTMLRHRLWCPSVLWQVWPWWTNTVVRGTSHTSAH